MSQGPDSSPGAGPGASELLRSLGLLVDGPIRWGEPAPSRAPGVFLVELPGGAAQPSLDPLALRRWLERVPELRLDGEQPSVQQLAQRLEQFWLPAEPVLYVGRSAKAIGGRLAALYQTVLGDARPHAGGHWLKTLAEPGRLRIWWAETDAHEEYEDALLGAVAARHSPDTLTGLPGSGPLLPFANLQDSAGRAKPHGLENSLRMPDQNAARPSSPVAGTQRTSRSPSRRSTAPGAGAGQQSRRSPKRALPPPSEPTYLSADGLQRLQQELDELRNGVRPGVIARVKAARELGDLRENAEYESARKEQSFVEGRIQALEAMIKSAVVVAAEQPTGVVVIGSTVTVESDGDEQVFVLVGSSEADPGRGRISYGSPVGQALLGRRAGEQVTIRLPRGEIRYVVREVG